MIEHYHANEEKLYFQVEYGNISEKDIHEFPELAFPEDGREIQAEKSKSLDSRVSFQ